MKKIDWITFAKALGITIAFMGIVFVLVWMSIRSAWVLLGLCVGVASIMVYHIYKDFSRNPIVDEREEAYFKGFADGKKAAEEDFLEGLHRLENLQETTEK